MLNLLNVFDNEEQLVVNRLGTNEHKDSFVERVDFGIAISNDEDVIDLLKGLKDKVFSLSNKEWSSLQELLPFDVPYREEENFDF